MFPVGVNGTSVAVWLSVFTPEMSTPPLNPPLAPVKFRLAPSKPTLETTPSFPPAKAEISTFPLNPPLAPVKFKLLPSNATLETTPSAPPPANELKSTLAPPGVAELVKLKTFVVGLKLRSVSSLIVLPSTSAVRNPLFATALSTKGSRFTLPLKPPLAPVTTRLFPEVVMLETTPSAPPPAFKASTSVCSSSSASCTLSLFRLPAGVTSTSEASCISF